MKTLWKAGIVLGLLIGSSICAMAGSMGAGVTWTFNDVNFDNGNTVTGWFLTNYAGTQTNAFSIVVSGPDGAQDFTASIFVNSYLPSQVGFANSDFSKYVDLYLTSPLNGAGGIIPFGPGLYGDGFDCGGSGGCGTLILADNPYLDGVVPEPSPLLIMGSSLAILGTMLRRKISRT